MTSSNLFNQGNNISEALSSALFTELESADTITPSLESEASFTDTLHETISLISEALEVTLPEKYSAADTIFGTNNPDILTGDEEDNNIIALDSNDTLLGLEGNDKLEGGEDNDIIIAGDHNDLVIGGNGDDHIRGQKGDDLISSGKGDDLAIGHQGDDYILGEAGKDSIYGGTGKDTLIGGDDDDYIQGNQGTDIIIGEAGYDTLWGDYQDTKDKYRQGNIFVLDNSPGHDLIKDFKLGKDKIGLLGELDFNDLSLIQSRYGATIKIRETGQSLGILEQIDPKDLSHDDFIEDFHYNSVNFIPPTITASLANDTGISNSDGLTNDPTITGNVRDGDGSEIVKLEARISSLNSDLYVDVTPKLREDGSFTFDREQLQILNGEHPVGYGHYTVDIIATDKAGNLSEITPVSFILDTHIKSL